MKNLALYIFVTMVGLSSAIANESKTYYVPQPIVAFGDTEEWTLTGDPRIKEQYIILGKPYFQKHNHGPLYDQIAYSNMMADSGMDSNDGLPRDCNLLSLHQIKITRKFHSKIVHLDLSEVKLDKNSVITIDVVAYAALECIRIVSHRYNHNIQLQIIPPKGGKKKWKNIESAFNEHDMAKPFQQP